MKQRMTLFMAILLIGIGLSNAQVSQVTGNVMSEEDGLPVVGASVLVKGTTVCKGKRRTRCLLLC